MKSVAIVEKSPVGQTIVFCGLPGCAADASVQRVTPIFGLP
jgi:hypothetical protein